MVRVRSLLVLLAAVALVASSSALAATETVEGDFTSVGVLPPECGSFLCTRGELTGDLEGTYFFTMTSLLPDSGTPGAFLYAGNSSITTADGTLQGEDTGIMYFTSGNPAPFVTTVNVVSGGGAYAGATGTIVATGSLDFTTNHATGTYTGSITTP